MSALETTLLERIAAGLLAITLALPILAVAATPTDDEYITAKPIREKPQTSEPVLKVDDLRAEWGGFLDNAAPSGAVYLHGAASLNGKAEGGWEYALGARLDVYGQNGGQSHDEAALDYTENYLRWRNADMRFTLGTQNILWGRVDELPPMDRLSRVDLSRFVLDKLPERRRAVPAVRLERFLGDYKLDTVWLPVFKPAVLPDAHSVWHPVDQVNGQVLGVTGIPAVLIQNASLTEDKGGGGGGGIRLTRAGGSGIDYGLSLQHARQSVPYYRLTAPSVLTAVHPYSWVAGGELETQMAGATWRMEATWSSDIPVTTMATSQYRTEQGIDLVMGAEFFPGDGDTRLTMQMAGHKTFTSEPVLDRAEFYALNGEIEHPFAHGRWQANLRFFAGLNERDFYFNPKLTYLGLDQHELFLAAHLFSGAEGTMGGFHRQHDLVAVGWQARF
ncbi:MAG: hypothetical protein KKG92_02510 [Gammaproteobacteria bacterium]|nr:hypothetical protein [Gammaproteobacteria bacterium]